MAQSLLLLPHCTPCSQLPSTSRTIQVNKLQDLCYSRPRVPGRPIENIGTKIASVPDRAQPGPIRLLDSQLRPKPLLVNDLKRHVQQTACQLHVPYYGLPPAGQNSLGVHRQSLITVLRTSVQDNMIHTKNWPQRPSDRKAACQWLPTCNLLLRILQQASSTVSLLRCGNLTSLVTTCGTQLGT